MIAFGRPLVTGLGAMARSRRTSEPKLMRIGVIKMPRHGRWAGRKIGCSRRHGLLAFDHTPK